MLKAFFLQLSLIHSASCVANGAVVKGTGHHISKLHMEKNIATLSKCMKIQKVVFCKEL